MTKMMLRALTLMSILVATSAGQVTYISAEPYDNVEPLLTAAKVTLAAGTTPASLFFEFDIVTALTADSDTVTITAGGAGAALIYVADGAAACAIRQNKQQVGGEKL